MIEDLVLIRKGILLFFIPLISYLFLKIMFFNYKEHLLEDFLWFFWVIVNFPILFYIYDAKLFKSIISNTIYHSILQMVMYIIYSFIEFDRWGGGRDIFSGWRWDLIIFLSISFLISYYAFFINKKDNPENNKII